MILKKHNLTGAYLAKNKEIWLLALHGSLGITVVVPKGCTIKSYTDYGHNKLIELPFEV